MENEPISRHHHFIPQVYLKKFSPDKEQLKILVYRTIVSHKKIQYWEQKSIENSASTNDLYNEATLEGESDKVEKWLGALPTSLHQL